ncbi:ribosome small subunit-dependent GTPase A [Lacihabitans sp. LS3-19]|uniref:ribosome small subunit-dependent GTPase A n=1 Tax=Lacihabitans sp. LS3-19 TaxID=2487335 RepID=UPI0020CDF6A8|nr:ribosome small subunit-dependent GTPase A [Lacihabitans sp. LS3-19]MCP9767524.1 ribosome small subunit-dependent GTPase A [Lacihabitans sp. LS3-19]
MENKLGTIFRSTGSWYEVEDEQKNVFSCRLKGKFKIKDLKVTNPLAVGDKVIFDLDDDKVGIIKEILPRKNYIIRKSVHKTAHGHLLACNIDQLVLIATLASPKTSLGFIDRFLVTAETFRIPVLIVFNKFDLLNKKGVEFQDALMDLYIHLGYDCISTSTLTEKGIDLLKLKLENKVSLISGHSGVGKSTLINILAPDLDLATSEISTFANKGVHTTTFSEMFELPNKTYIIDSPGIKELGLVDIANEELAHFFPEFRDLLGQCKFHNCLHINEPKCAVKDAVEEGLISESRYMSYLSMFENDDNRR